MKKINYINLIPQWKLEKKELLKIIDKCLSSGEWVGGEEIEKFELNIAKKCNAKYCLALNSGTDALVLALHSIGVKKNDEIITTPNSFIASTAAIVHLGAKPIFIDVSDDQNINPKLIARKITNKTKAIMPVHLTGRVSEMKSILNISKKYKIPIIEDAAQSIGSKYFNKYSGTFGEIGCFSAHPLKNLNASGDSGYILTNNYKIFKKIKSLRNHGIEKRNLVRSFGYVSRMDNLQASILNFRLKKLDHIIEKRRLNVSLYKKLINRKEIFIPEEKSYEFNSYHTFVIQAEKRDKLKKFLQKKGVETAIHYPIPIHLQECSKYLGYKKGDFPIAEIQAKKILSLPVNQFLTKKEIVYISKLVNLFYSNS